jgi:hypothetical protein
LAIISLEEEAGPSVARIFTFRWRRMRLILSISTLRPGERFGATTRRFNRAISPGTPTPGRFAGSICVAMAGKEAAGQGRV